MSFATDQVALLKDAYARVVKGQTVRLGDRQVTRADAAWISAELDKWLRRVASEAASANGNSGFSIADFSGRDCGESFRTAG